MAEVSIAELKAASETGDTITQDLFWNLIDSCYSVGLSAQVIGLQNTVDGLTAESAASKLSLSGGTMMGNINMGGYDISNASDIEVTILSADNVYVNGSTVPEIVNSLAIPLTATDYVEAGAGYYNYPSNDMVLTVEEADKRYSNWNTWNLGTVIGPSLQRIKNVYAGDVTFTVPGTAEGTGVFQVPLWADPSGETLNDIFDKQAFPTASSYRRTIYITQWQSVAWGPPIFVNSNLGDEWSRNGVVVSDTPLFFPGDIFTITYGNEYTGAWVTELTLSNIGANLINNNTLQGELSVFQSVSANWNSAYTTVQNNSATLWDSTSDIEYLSGQIDAIVVPDISLIQSTSGNWNSAYTYVVETSSTNYITPVSADSATTFTITSAVDIKTYINMTGNMTLAFDRNQFDLDALVFGTLSIKPNTHVLSADPASVTGFDSLAALVTGEYNTIFYNSPPQNTTMEVV